MTQPTETLLVKMAGEMREGIDTLNVKELAEITRLYLRTLERLQGDIDSLVQLMHRKGTTAGRLVQLERYQHLMNRILEEVEGYSAVLRDKLEKVLESSLKKGIEDSIKLMEGANEQFEIGLEADFSVLHTEAIKTMLGFLGEDGPLYARIKLMAPYMAEKVAEVLLEGVTLGYGPRKIASMLTAQFGILLTDSLRLVRTAQLWAYREASRANYLANSDIVEGWMWYSALLPGRTCMSCVAMHGTIHPLHYPLNDHYNGLCTMLPVLYGANMEVQSGEAWFNSQSASVQKGMMGPGKYDAWVKGDIQMSQLTKEVQDFTYGVIRVETALKDLFSN